MAMVVPDSVGAGTDVVTAAADEKEGALCEVYTNWLIEEALEVAACDEKGQWRMFGGQLETVETSVIDTMTPPEELGMRLPLDIAGSELTPVEDDAEELAMRAELTACVVDTARVVDTAGVEELARVDCRVAEELTGGESVHSVFSK